VLYLDLAYSDEQFYSGYRAVFGEDTNKYLTTGFRGKHIRSGWLLFKYGEGTWCRLFSAQ
jgi:hypothetical protein